MLKQVILDTFRFHRGYVELLTMDIPDERMCEQPGSLTTHAAWQLGHMAGSLDGFAAEIGAAKQFDDAWQAKFGQASTPTGLRSDYPSKTELLAAYDRRQTAIIEAIENAPDELFNQPLSNEEMQGFFPTKGHFVLFGILSHDGMHCGQLASWRRAVGLPEALNNRAKLAEMAEAGA